MPRKPIKFELDFMIKDIFPRFTVKQFDDVSFNIKPLNQGLDYDTSNMIGKIFVGVNNDMFMQTTDITVSSDNINVLLDKNMLQKNGRAYAEIELTDEAGTITSSSFIFDIDPKIGEGGMIPGEYEGFVEKYERLISEFKAQINSSIDNSNNLIDKTIKNCNTSVDTKLSAVDSRLNSKVAEVDNKLNTVDSLVNTKITNINNTLNKKVSEVDSKLDTVDGLITAKVSDFERRFSALTSSQQQNSEVIDAREGEVSLKARLDKDIENPKKLYTSIEGTEISVDSLEGYLKDIEILGNTVQDQDNLADIRSVGDKLENQELYEIPVLSCGKNLLNIKDYGDFKAGSNACTIVYNEITDTYEMTYSGTYIHANLDLTKNLYLFEGKTLLYSCKYSNSNSSAKFTIYLHGTDKEGKVHYFNSVNNTIPKDTLTSLNLRVFANNSSVSQSGVFTFSQVQVEEGAVITEYEPYKEHKLTILSSVQLEKVGDVADRIVCKDGVWGVEKNVKTKTFTDDENWNVSGQSLCINPKLDFDNSITDASIVASMLLGNQIVWREDYLYQGTRYGIGYKATNDMFRVRLEGINSKEELNAYIKTKPIVLKYQTINPQFIPLPYDQQIKLKTFANKTNIHFLTEIEPTLKASVPKSIGASVSSNTEQIDILYRELDKIKKLLLQSEVVF